MATNKEDSFDYNLFIEKLYGVAKNMKDGTDSISDMETVYTLIDGLVEHALVPAIEEHDFSMPAEFEVIHRIFKYVYSSLKTPRENLIFLVGESLVFGIYRDLFTKSDYSDVADWWMINNAKDFISGEEKRQ